MSYQVLSLKWRPQTFPEVVGQEHVTRTLVNAFKKNRVAQAYLFTGPRGVGKTTTARLLAKALNCLKTPGAPCNECNNCLEIADGRNMDVLEIDGASNRGIEEIRNLRELIKYAPINSRYKIFIIDEVHMLTTQAFNALLRTLEEPPEHGKFILATTDVHKVPATIISRCQRFDFNRITVEIIRERLKFILQEEKISVDEDAVTALARKADGSMRDALSLLDQVIAFGGEKITYDEIVDVLGLIPQELYFQFTDSLKAKNGAQLLQIMQKGRSSGIPVSELVLGLNEHIRNLLYATLPQGADLLEVNDDLKKRYQKDAGEWEVRDLLRIAQMLTELEAQVKRATQPYILLELTMMKLLEMDSSVTIDELLSRFPGGTDPYRKKPSFSRPEPKSESKPEPKPQSQPVIKERIVEPLQQDLVPPGPKVITEKEILKEKAASEKKQQKEVVESEPKGSVSIELKEIEEHWESILEGVSSKRTSVGTILEHCKPKRIEKNKLEIVLYDRPRFNLDLLKKNKPLIEKEIQTKIGKDIRILFGMENNGEKPTAAQKKKIKEKSTVDNPAVSRIIELFDGEIIR